MLKRIFAPIVLAVSLHAQADTIPDGARWTYAYSGFHETFSNQFYDNYFFTVSFGGTDANDDGMLVLSELDFLTIDGRDYLSCDTVFDYYYKCHPDSFSVIPGDGDSLRLEAGWFGNDEAFTSWNGRYSVGEGLTITHNVYNDREEYHSKWVSTDQTVLQITSTIPEPGTGYMFALGLAGMAAWRLARRGRGLSRNGTVPGSLAGSIDTGR